LPETEEKDTRGSSKKNPKWVYPDAPEKRDKYERQLKSEERRAVVWLGILAVIVAFDVYLRGDRAPDVYNRAFFYNFFCNSPCSHITLFWVPFLDVLIYFWIGYAICALIYFSEDFLPGRRGSIIRKSSRIVGHVLLAFYPLSVGFYLLVGISGVYLPDLLQAPSVVAESYILGLFVVWILQRVTGRRIFGERSIFRKPLEVSLKFTSEGMQLIAERLVHAKRWILKGSGELDAGPVNAKQTIRLLILAIEVVVISFAYLIEHLSGINLFYAFGVPLWAIIVSSAIIGWLERRKRRSSD
jgi:hypothetical protein